MAIHPGARTASLPASPLERLVREQGLRQFGLFFVTGEGEFMPNGDEEKSGYVIDEFGHTYSFWTGWDAARGTVVLTEWEPIADDPDWHVIGEYQRARERAGLAQDAGSAEREVRYVRWTDEHGVVRFIPAHVVISAVEGLVFMARLMKNAVVSVGRRLLSRDAHGRLSEGCRRRLHR